MSCQPRFEKAEKGVCVLSCQNEFESFKADVKRTRGRNISSKVERHRVESRIYPGKFSLRSRSSSALTNARELAQDRWSLDRIARYVDDCIEQAMKQAREAND